MRLWRKCWQISGIYGQPKGHRSQPGSSQGSHGNTPSQEQEGATTLTGKLVALGRFIARFTDELRPFFLAIRKAGAHGWTDSCQNAFEKIKHCLTQPPILSSPIQRRNCICIWRALADVETRYSKMELTALALRSAAQKLRPYFQAHPVINIPEDPANTTNQVNKNGGLCELTEPHAHQALELGSYYSPQLGNIWSKPSGWDSLPLTMKQNMRPSCPDWTSPLLYPSPNSGSTATHNSWKHVQEEYEAKDARMARYLAKVRNTLQQFTEWTIEKIKRADNRRADALAGIAASLPSKKPFYCLYMCNQPSVAEISTCNTIEEPKQRPRMDGHMQNISGQALYPEIQTGTQSPGASCPFHPDWGHLYKRSFTGPYLRCLGHSEAQYVLAELHEGICGNHSEDDLWHIELIRKDTIGQQ
ncbi:hypothetical protein CK203_041504 [Vitis vinifera]|uniref:RNase H type-1 domain-containing protein n=1 Tax=Vitis vinifera TaxID=29760 RepID=A0A438HNM2_VITVI|nr:hypothetical protein CK203_041504 [Vitis vinifera]